MLSSFSQLFSSDLTKADAARDRKEWDFAAAAYMSVLESEPDNASIWVQYGHALKEMGRLAEAESAYRRSLSIDPRVADTYLQLGHVLKVRGELAHAQRAYQKAADLDPRNSFALAELSALARVAAPPVSTGAHFNDLLEEMPVSSGTTRLIFDCSDLIQYFRDNRLPTGIQRVQVNIVTNVSSDVDFHIIHFDLKTRAWREISRLDFQRLVNCAQRVDTVSENAWEGIRDQIIETGPEFTFIPKDTLINLGTSWWIPDYFLIVRGLKVRYGIYYVPFIHDCIPLITPEYCSAGLVVEFESWLQGVFAHSDAYLANSDSTSNDLQRIARQFGWDIKPPTVVRLDGDIRTGGHFTSVRDADAHLKALFSSEQLPPNPNFVLMVSTLEARKNHLLALHVWQKMITELGFAATPYLICVGKAGWRFEETEDYLATKPELHKRVRFLSNLNDGVLAELYRRCICTFYPSHYEGWGLPVTEGLCYGKVGVVARNSSLPEAGGAYCAFFEPDFLRDAYDVVAQIITDRDYRDRLERKIATDFKPRSWATLASDVVEAARRLTTSEGETTPTTGIPHLEAGRIYSFLERSLIDRRTNQVSGEDLRLGTGWHKCEDWGTWTKERQASLCMQAPSDELKNCVLYLCVRGPNGIKSELTVFSPELDRRERFDVDDGTDHYLALPLGNVPSGLETISIVLSTSQLLNLRAFTDSKDQRDVGIGLCWAMFCESADIAARLDLLEMIYLRRPQPARMAI